MRKLLILFLAISLLPVGGCAAFAEGMIRNALGIDDDDDDDFTRRLEDERKLKLERKWIQHWRDHPEENPAMTEAFKDDYR